jgi:hypothetical protein
MDIQVWFTSDILPEFSQFDKILYSPLVSNQMLDIGNTVNGRHLVRCMTTTDKIDTILYYLNLLGKTPIILGTLDIDGNDLLDDQGNVKYPRDYTTYNSFFAPDANGNIPAGNISAGWTDFDFIPEII